MSYSCWYIGGGALLIFQVACSGKELPIGAMESTTTTGGTGSVGSGGTNTVSGAGGEGSVGAGGTNTVSGTGEAGGANTVSGAGGAGGANPAVGTGGVGGAGGANPAVGAGGANNAMAGHGGSGSSDVPEAGSADARDGSTQVEANPPTTPDGAVIVGSDGGWKWNVSCPQTIDEFCDDTASTTTPCIKKWSDASLPATWCSQGLAPTMIGYCHGYWAVSVFPESKFTTFYYDVGTGNLVHVDSNAIPSFTQCIAGVSGSRFDIFGCDYGEVACPP